MTNIKYSDKEIWKLPNGNPGGGFLVVNLRSEESDFFEVVHPTNQRCNDEAFANVVIMNIEQNFSLQLFSQFCLEMLYKNYYPR